MKLTPEAEAVLERAAFDKEFANYQRHKECTPIIRSMMSRGEAMEACERVMQSENARLLPIITKLLEDNCRMAEALDFYSKVECTDCAIEYGYYEKGMIDLKNDPAIEALTAHRETMKELGHGL